MRFTITLTPTQYTTSSADPLSAQNHANLLQNFVKSVLRAEPALQWIREQSQLIGSVRNKRDTGDGDDQQDTESSLMKRSWSEWDDDVVAVDDSEDGEHVMAGEEAWYNSFRQSECDGNSGPFCDRFHGKDQLKPDATSALAAKEVDWFETYKVVNRLGSHILIVFNVDTYSLELWK